MKKIILLIGIILFIGGCSTMANPVAEIKTNYGTMKIELFEDKAPITVENFIKLAEDGFYENVIFHRIIEDFMIQGGDPTGTGRGGPGYTINDEFHPDLKHDRKGILSMANAGPNTGGSQFFITLIPTPWLDNRHSVFGALIEGEDVLDQIGSVETDSQDRPLDNVVIESVSILR
ncbi:MAG: peptidylprolyl isomerase [Candidatus Woesearchaeota archaeon]